MSVSPGAADAGHVHAVPLAYGLQSAIYDAQPLQLLLYDAQSRSPLSAKAPGPTYVRPGGFGAGNVTRTHDLLITNQLLYRLSYASAPLSRLKILS